MELGLVYACARNGVIGKGGVLPWHLPEDLAHFKAVTMGQSVIMGRRTWESIPLKFRPLPGRRNIVVTRQADWRAEGAEAFPSLERAIAACEGEPRAWVIGGAELFAKALGLAHVAEVTEIDADFDGDVSMPRLPAPWRETAREAHRNAAGLAYSFITYRKLAS